MTAGRRGAATKINALVADIDGALVTDYRKLTARAKAAVAQPRASGVAFSLISSRPPRGWLGLIEPLEITAPVAGFNGAVLAAPGLAPWLKKNADEIDGWRNRGESAVLTSSALKRSYRNIIIGDRPGATLVYLRGSQDLIRRRLAGRRGHFMPAAVLDRQFASVREPTPDERPIDVDVDREPAAIVAEIVDRLEQRRRSDKMADATSRAPQASQTGQKNGNT